MNRSQKLLCLEAERECEMHFEFLRFRLSRSMRSSSIWLAIFLEKMQFHFARLYSINRAARTG